MSVSGRSRLVKLNVVRCRLFELAGRLALGISGIPLVSPRWEVEIYILSWRQAERFGIFR